MNYREEVLKHLNISIEEIKLLEESTEDIYRINSFKDIVEHLTQYTPIYETLINKIGTPHPIKELSQVVEADEIDEQISENFKTISINLKKYEDSIRDYRIDLWGGKASLKRIYSRPSIDIINRNNLIRLRLVFSEYNKLLGLVLQGTCEYNNKFAEYSNLIKYKEELKLTSAKMIRRNFAYGANDRDWITITQSIFTLDDIKNEVFEDVLNKYISIGEDICEHLENLKEQKLEIYLTKEDIKDSYKYDNDQGCYIEGCNHKSEYAVFEYNKNTDIRNFMDAYLCKKHLDEYESNKDNNDNIIIQYYKRNFKVEKNLLKTIAEKEKEDYINVTKDIDTFVELVTNENLTLPMNIGIFGDWGSGKSFFINNIHKKISKNENILSIKFNAWNYYDSDITINLVRNIFKELDEKIKGPKNTGKMSDNAEYLKKYKEIRKDKNKKEIERIQNEIKVLENKDKNYINKIIENLKPFINESDFKLISDIESDLNLISSTGADVNQICSIVHDMYFKEIKKIYKYIIRIDIRNICHSIMKNAAKWSILIGCIFYIYIKIRHTFSFKPVYIDIPSFIVVGFFGIRESIKAFNNSKLRDSISKLKVGLEQISKDKNEIEVLEQKIESLESESDESIEIDFIINMLNDKCNKYDEKIGFISTIKDDIDKLSFLKKVSNDNCIQNIKIDKIVLIIDDLDRCPAKKVVEVLQTIQLLLSTEMFIVIIAIDTKWVNKCITSEYSDMLTDDNDLFAINYLEKIIHIPFWIESLDNKNSFKFIEKMCEKTNTIENDNKKTSTKDNSDNRSNANKDENTTESKDMATKELAISTERDNIGEEKEEVKEKESNEEVVKEEEPIKNINLTQDDLEILRNMEFLLDDISPRKIKRFFNTILLIKLKYRTDRFRYKNLLFIATSIVLKPEYSRQLYRDIIANSINNDIKTIGIFMENYIKNKYENSREFKYLEAFSKYIERNMLTDLEIDKFKNYIHEAARYTYYYEEIFKYNNKDKSKNEQNSNNENLLQFT